MSTKTGHLAQHSTIFRHLTVALCLSAYSLLAIFGCGSSRDEIDSAVPLDAADNSPEVAVGKLELISIEPIVYSGKGDPYGKLLVVDNDFTKLDVATLDEMPTFGKWSLANPNSARTEIRKVKLASDIYQGTALEIGNSVPSIELRQPSPTIPVNDVPAKLVASLTAKTEASDELALRVVCDSAGRVEEYVRAIPGSGVWTTVSVSKVWPVGSIPTNIQLSITRRGATEGSAVVKQVEAYLVRHDAAAAGNLGRELLLNGGFEDSGWTKSMAPWYLSLWGGNAGKSASIVIDPEAPERGYVASLPKPDADPGGLSLVQVVPALDASVRGKTITARVSGKAAAPDQLRLLVKCKLGSEELRATSAHPGDGNWHEFAATATIPPDQYPAEVRVELVRGVSVNASPVLIDGVSLQID
ncbi:MAG: hypothetical protein IT366_16380 [Candidatus Hydrogenedentes bacterium]|nr:hypothetical protein [Candidatus Hydrogenedentota bacterium]